MSALRRLAAAATLLAAPIAARAADAAPAAPPKENWTAIIMFGVFVVLTLGITYWASRRTRSAADFYAAGGGITGFQNGIAISGDFMSAASFLGISAMVYTAGFDGLLYSIGFLVGWPIIMFLMAERLRNLGRYSMADVAAYRLEAGPGPHDGGGQFAGGGGLLSHCANGRRRAAHPAPVRPAI